MRADCANVKVKESTVHVFKKTKINQMALYVNTVNARVIVATAKILNPELNRRQGASIISTAGKSKQIIK